MATKIRPELSETNPYYISKHRYYELKHHCMQYPEWEKKKSTIENSIGASTPNYYIPARGSSKMDPVAKLAMVLIAYEDLMDVVDRVCLEAAGPCLYPYLKMAVTNGTSYTTLVTKHSMPCGKDMFYDIYRKFFWLLDKSYSS